MSLSVRSGAEDKKVSVELVRAPELEREMKKYRDDNFELTVRDITFFDRATEHWKEDQTGVLVEQVSPGGWASLGQLSVGDLILEVDNQPVPNVQVMEQSMQAIAQAKPAVVVLKVRSGIHTKFVELEPKWEVE